MKTTLTKNQKEVRRSCLGRIGGLTLIQHSNATDFLGRYGLDPVAMRVGDKLLSFDKVAYRRAVREGQQLKVADYCMPFYDARDCADVMGSPSPNWTTWARVLFGIGDAVAAAHPDYIVLSSNNPEHAEVRRSIMQKNRPVRSTPLISTTAVVFYLAAQKQWSDAPRYFSVVEPLKRILVKNSIIVLGLQLKGRVLPPDDASDLDALLAKADPLPAATSTLLVGDVIADAGVVDLLGDALSESPAAPLSVPAPLPAGVPGADRLLEMDEAEFEAYRQDTLAAFAEAAARRQAAKDDSIWDSGKICKRKRWQGRSYDCKVWMSYEDGSVVEYIHTELAQRHTAPRANSLGGSTHPVGGALDQP